MFRPFEWMIAARYLRARRAEGFISVIAWFSLVGIALGVATLIIVMAVMNGFRTELLDRILGLNGHISVLTYSEPMTDYAARAGVGGGVGRQPRRCGHRGGRAGASSSHGGGREGAACGGGASSGGTGADGGLDGHGGA